MLMNDIATRVRQLINDPDKVRWTDDELFRWAGDAEVFVINYRPDAAAVTETITLAAGTKQSLPSNRSRLLDVIRAVKSDGNPANSIRYIDRQTLEAQVPNWHAATQNVLIKNVVYDNRVPTEFYVFPPAKAGAKIDVSLVKVPVAITALTDPMNVSDMYREIVTNYVVFRCYCKDTEARGDRAQLFLMAVSQALGVKLSKDAAFQPDLNNKNASPSAGVQMGAV